MEVDGLSVVHRAWILNCSVLELHPSCIVHFQVLGIGRMSFLHLILKSRLLDGSDFCVGLG